MKDLMKAVEEVKVDLDRLNIPYSQNIRWSTNARFKNLWGQCRKKDGYYLIIINKELLGDDVDDMALKSTIAHEMLHTVWRSMEHNGVWEGYVFIMHRAYPHYHIAVSTSREAKGLGERK